MILDLISKAVVEQEAKPERNHAGHIRVAIIFEDKKPKPTQICLVYLFGSYDFFFFFLKRKLEGDSPSSWCKGYK